MQTSNAKTHQFRLGFTLIELLVVVAIIALLISILLPSLNAAKASAKAAVCASRHKAAATGWIAYGNDFNGKNIAIWDEGPYSWASTSCISNQAPYALWYYFQGESIPGPAYHGGKGGWWDHLAGSYGGSWSPITSTSDTRHCPAYHCAELEYKMGEGRYITQFNLHLLSLTLFVPRIYNQSTKLWEYEYERYMKPDLFTHPGSTGMLMCLAGDDEDSKRTYDGYNAWTKLETINVADPHLEKSNYLFADGHVELRVKTASTEDMWSPLLKRGQR